MELAGLDPDLGPQHVLLVHRQLAGLLIVGPVVRRVVRNVQNLLAKAEVAADFPRAHEILTKVLMGGDPQMLDARRKRGAGVS